jgi:NAD(P)H-dependent flavin oxidoreductase YrpB (nitropropane dioxygenase family)
MRNKLCDQFGIEFPIFAFSHCRDVVAAVSRAGGMGVLGALAFSPEQLEIELAWIDEHVEGKPYGVDVVMPAKLAEGAADATKAQLEAMISQKHRDFIEATLTKHGVPPLPADVPRTESLLGWTPSGGHSHVDVALRHDIRLLVNALGPPPADVVAQAHARGVPVAALIGTPEQALKQVQAGVDIIVASGTEAGGHTGEISTMVLTPQVVDAVAPVPVLAAGGIGSGRQMAAAMALGAAGVWTGSMWLTVKESDLQPAVVQRVLRATSRDTVRSRAMTGKPARQLRTPWTEAWDGPDSPDCLPMPLQFMATAEAYSRMYRAAEADPDSPAAQLAGTPIGQIIGSLNAVRPAREVIFNMVEEYLDTIGKLSMVLAEADGQAAQ